MDETILLSAVTCPVCGFAKAETMPTDACLWFYECEGCKAMLTPRAGDCCIFCSFGSTRCPPMLKKQSGVDQCRDASSSPRGSCG
ncbi:MAG TPA: GDCCVxC domain-containing (seleno)protein [Albitalea sp.]|uniref:GDCCVxC domain-containing (seleno)protein n=1 Tax=Piscinibacter sp. TaxID=1903157 RepID=UPI002ED2498E